MPRSTRELTGPSLSILLVNVTGSFVIGFFATLTDPSGRYLVAPALRTNLW